ncbi:hypothetical protein PHYPSEUDO_011609 [Phytophthora pseudosyringae]|uniref:Uncharacterized protein n=1 Tax=Phytophthora pseudosyringae TaxID=221518 RepID=A0A8T1V830_9STRA|nr:hypothetical protein PHYPSEUDO_011609 [Phytophthora pseudosyringae]
MVKTLSILAVVVIITVAITDSTSAHQMATWSALSNNQRKLSSPTPHTYIMKYANVWRSCIHAEVVDIPTVADGLFTLISVIRKMSANEVGETSATITANEVWEELSANFGRSLLPVRWHQLRIFVLFPRHESFG